jgi:hypothetical protein
MALDANIRGSTSGLGAEVNASNQLKVTLENNAISNANNVGIVRSFSENDPGTITGFPYLKPPESSLDYRLRVGVDTILFTDTFNALFQNSTNWAYTFVTMTAAQPGAGTVNFGTVQGTGATHGAFMRSYQYFPLIGTAPLAVEISAGQFTSALVANEVWLMGLGLPSAAATPPTDGVWFQLTTAGLIGVLAYSGTTTQTGVLLSLAQTIVSDIDKYTIVVGESEVEFWKNDVLLAELFIPVGNGQPFIASSQPVFFHKYCTGAVSNTNTMRVSDITVSLMDIQTTKPWSHQAATQGMAGYVLQNGITVPATGAKTSLWANSTAPTAAAITNTGATFTGLGGIAAVLPTLTASNDGILFTYQNPVPSINITGRNLIITGVTVQGAVSVILAGGPVIYAYALAWGHTAVSLATQETLTYVTATTHAPRILSIGMETYPATANVGTLGGVGCKLILTTPVVVRPGEWVSIIARNIGTVTTTGAITIVASYDAYWE